MATTIIPITPQTLDVITVLNGGACPELEDHDTFFVYKGEDEPADIITADEFESGAEEWWAIVKIMYRNDE